MTPQNAQALLVLIALILTIVAMCKQSWMPLVAVALLLTDVALLVAWRWPVK